jgi:hypothetical protein
MVVEFEFVTSIQECIFKMCPKFTYQIVGQRRKLKAINKNCSSMSIYFLTKNFLNIFSEFYMKPVARG